MVFITLFPFHRPVQIFLCKISIVCCLKYPYSYFSSYLCFQVIIVLFVFMLLVLLLAAVISPSQLFLMKSLSAFINAAMLSSMLASPLPPSFLDMYNLSMSSLECKALCFLVLWSICLISSLVHFKNRLENLTRGIAQAFIPFMRFLMQSSFSRSFHICLGFSFLIFSFYFACLMMSTSNIPKCLELS